MEVPRLVRFPYSPTQQATHSKESSPLLAPQPVSALALQRFPAGRGTYGTALSPLSWQTSQCRQGEPKGTQRGRKDQAKQTALPTTPPLHPHPPPEVLNLVRYDRGRVRATPLRQQRLEHAHRARSGDLPQPPINAQLLHRAGYMSTSSTQYIS